MLFRSGQIINCILSLMIVLPLSSLLLVECIVQTKRGKTFTERTKNIHRVQHMSIDSRLYKQN